MSAIDNFERMLASGKDSALLRFGLANEYMKRGDFTQAAKHAEQAVRLDPDYSAAWKVLGKALVDSGDASRAIDAYRAGIAAAERKGDKQAAREMQVFLKRLEKRSAAGGAAPV